MTSPVECDEVTTAALRASLARIGELDDSHFRAFQWALVSRYRISPDEQECIAVELTRPSTDSLSPKSIDRIDETLAMLDHVHDPLISGSALHA